ncbi:MAG: Ig-like domain-containing protein [Porphyromonadaceae bacterium]|nr:Ig-like domain-containing protein [Porphyromonadaceae bacterium]
MRKKNLFLFSFLFLTLLMMVLLQACANMAAPTGGAYDVDPPKVRQAKPNFNSLGASPSKIEIEFDENIKIKSPAEKVIITPPQQILPIIRSVGKKAVVELKDELKPNTTYTIDFTDAIADNNEENPLENFVFSFSTGDQLDTLSISGKVLAAQDLEPVTGTYVGIHSNFDDTVFTRVPFERISRTDSRGNFTVRGMAPGKYKVFALNDQNRDYKYDNPQEAIAFLDSIVIPSSMSAVRQDTVFVDSITIDTIRTVQYTRFLPDDLVLRSFQSDFQRQYLQKHERTEPHKLTLYFAAPTVMPDFSLLQPEVSNDDWYVTERSAGNDTLLLWITDSLIYQQDSIRMKINYTRTDSLNKNYIDTDTISFNIRKSARDKREQKNDEKKDGEEAEKEQIRFLGITSNVQSTFELFNPIRFEFEQPIVRFDSSFVRLEMAVDSLFEPVPFRMERDTLNPRKLTIRPRWEPGGKYKLTVDSALLISPYGIWNNKYEQSFTVKPLDQYGNLEVNIVGLPEGKVVFVELLDKSDKPFRKSFVKGNTVRFQDLQPGEIYARLVIDENRDGVWTTGNYEDKRQPEMVYYYPGKWMIRAYSDHMEEWQINTVEVIRQKPLEITKNKPEEKKRRDPNRDRNNQQQNQQSSPFGSSGSRGFGSTPRM